VSANLDPTVARLLGARDFGRWFGEAWMLPKPEPFLAAVGACLTDDVVSVQPVVPTAHGPREFLEVFRGLFRLLPDATAVDEVVAVEGDRVVVLAVVTGTAAGRPVSFRVSDHFTLVGDRICRRETFTDPLTLLGQVVARPAAWPAVVRMRLGR